MNNKLKFADVSVVIPVYNSAETIERALFSVLNQSLLPAEVIIVNDASEDDSLRIIEQFSINHIELKIKIISQNLNMGAATARNTGWDTASCYYVAFLDSDDIWHHEKIHYQYSWMISHSDYLLTGHKCPLIKKEIELEKDSHFKGFRNLKLIDFLLSNQFSTPTVMLVRELPYRFLNGKRYAEDYLLWLQIISAGVKTAFLKQSLAGIFKPAYGTKGLSANLWSMELGELNAYKYIYKNGRISFVMLNVLYIYSFIKYLRRLIKIKL